MHDILLSPTNVRGVAVVVRGARSYLQSREREAKVSLYYIPLSVDRTDAYQIFGRPPREGGIFAISFSVRPSAERWGMTSHKTSSYAHTDRVMGAV